jgi:phosphate transport system substrate-binding protein
VSMSRPRRAALLVALAAAAVVPAAVPAAASAGKPTITLSGSTSVAPLAAKLARKYVDFCNGCVKFKLLQGGSDVGINDVAHQRVTIGMSSRDPRPGDPGGIVFNKIAKDALCVITHQSNNVSNFGQEQVQAIFGGDVRSWNAVPGSNQSGTIDVIVRTPASGTQDAFQRIFMGSKRIFSGASQRGSNGLVQQAVRGSGGSGVGYVSLAFTEGTNPVAYKGVPCTLRNAKSGQYGGVRNFYFVTFGAAKGAVRKWIRWIRGNRQADRITATEWVPLS